MGLSYQVNLAGVLVVLTTGALAGCAQMPEVGPPAMAIVKPSATPQRYALIKVTPAVLAALAAQKPSSLSTVADFAPAPIQTIGVGDYLDITIWDSGGLFAPTTSPASSSSGSTSTLGGTQAISLPTAIVDQRGDITVPYAGRLHVTDKTASQVEAAIVQALKGKTIQPQVAVKISQNNSSFTTVVGDVVHPGRVQLPIGGLRLLDAIALSGGTAAPASDMAVQLTRNGTTQRVRLIQIMQTPTENIFLRPNDLVFLDKEPQSVVVLGAANHNAQVPFAKSDLTLAEALGNGGGLVDLEADPYGVFVFRYETRAVIEKFNPAVDLADEGSVPVIFQISLKEPDGFFMAQRFKMSDRDLVYISNSQSVQFSKLIRIFSMIGSIFNRSSVLSN